MASPTTLLKASGEQLEEVLLNPDIQDSLVTLVKELPRLATVMTIFSKACDVATEVMTDPELLGDVEDKIRQTIGARGGGVWSAVQEAKQRAERDCSHIGVFGLMRLLKDPTVQKNLRFAQALLNVMSERSSKNGTTCAK